MKSLFSDPAESVKFGLSDFERMVVSGSVDWKAFYSLQGEERENAIDLLLNKHIISVEREGNFEVIRADSCRQDFAFDYKGKRVYFTNPKYVDSFRTYLESRGCVNIAKRR